MEECLSMYEMAESLTALPRNSKNVAEEGAQRIYELSLGKVDSRKKCFHRTYQLRS